MDDWPKGEVGALPVILHHRVSRPALANRHFIGVCPVTVVLFSFGGQEGLCGAVPLSVFLFYMGIYTMQLNGISKYFLVR